jgi:hypothetical protein
LSRRKISTLIFKINLKKNKFKKIKNNNIKKKRKIFDEDSEENEVRERESVIEDVRLSC